ncbi:LysR family transcriptional regulator [Photobacterium japonica]|uniref:LysR family transcriptional regulator n=1 Tax=Photobacterium japonica TaxID=2910235 RepID=UPI003D0F4DDF
MDKFDCLNVFIRTAQLGSFTATANELNLTQSAVSKKIAWLERQVGFALFHRNSRKIALTPQGDEYAKHCEQVLTGMHTIETRLRGNRLEVRGELRLSVPSVMVTQLLAAPISQFMALHPALSVNVSVSDRQVDLIERHIDVAIRVADLSDSRYKARFLFNNTAVFLAAPDYLARRGRPATPKDLAKYGESSHACLTYSLIRPSHQWAVYEAAEPTNKANIHVQEVFTSDSAEMLLKMASLGHGIAALPRWMVEPYFVSGVLEPVLPEYQAMSLPMHAVFKADAYQPYRIRAFVDFLVAYFNDNPVS